MYWFVWDCDVFDIVVGGLGEKLGLECGWWLLDLFCLRFV